MFHYTVNMVLEILKSSIAFLTTLPLKGDTDVLRRNLWIFPFTGIFIGFIISIPSFFSLWIFCLLLYIAIEGINHIDGLADFGDSFFAPQEKKIIALKDVNIGAGGASFLIFYFIILYYAFQRVDPFEIIFSQLIAKFSMLILLTTSKPAWKGMGAYMMRFARKKDLVIGTLSFSFSIIEPSLLISLILVIPIVLSIREYSERNFGGVSGDIIGACNCISFATTLLFCSLFEMDIFNILLFY